MASPSNKNDDTKAHPFFNLCIKMASQSNNNDDDDDTNDDTKDDTKEGSFLQRKYNMQRNKNYFQNIGDAKDDINDFGCDRGYGLAFGASVGDGIGNAYLALVGDKVDGKAIKSMYIRDSFGQVSNFTKQAIEIGSHLCNKLCSNSPSNNSVLVDTPMACSLTSFIPLILYGSKLSNINLYHLLQLYTEQTEKDYTIFLINACYAIMVKYLVRCPENKKDRHIYAIIEMIKWLQETKNYAMIKWLQVMNNNNNNNNNKRHLFKLLKSKNISRKWLQGIQQANTDCEERVYILQVAFLQCCYHLVQNNSFYDAILSVVKQGGCVAINASIVGGMNGVLNGLYNLNSLYVKKIDAQKYYQMSIIQTLFKYSNYNLDVFDINYHCSMINYHCSNMIKIRSDIEAINSYTHECEEKWILEAEAYFIVEFINALFRGRMHEVTRLGRLTDEQVFTEMQEWVDETRREQKESLEAELQVQSEYLHNWISSLAELQERNNRELDAELAASPRF